MAPAQQRPGIVSGITPTTAYARALHAVARNYDEAPPMPVTTSIYLQHGELFRCAAHTNFGFYLVH